MGDRAHIVVKDGKSKVYLYTHWSGSDLPDIVRKSLKRATEQERGQRLTDGPYLTRILFCDLVAGEERGTTGFGISSRPCEDTSRDVTVNVDAQTVTQGGGFPVSIADYIKGA